MTRLDWMHPSYRDLVIDELVYDKELRKIFLGTAGIQDISLALSTIGGHDGKRTMPLIGDEESKKIIEERVKVLSSTENEFGVLNLLTILDYAKKQNGPQSGWITDLLYTVLSSFPRLMAGKTINLYSLDYYCKLTLDFKPLLTLPDFETTWNYHVQLIQEVIDEDGFFTGSEIKNWARLTLILKKNEPRFLTQINYPDSFSSLISEIITNLESDVTSSISPLTNDIIKDEIYRINEIMSGLTELSSLESDFMRIIAPIKDSLEQKRNEYLENTHEEEPDIDNIDDELIDTSGFDVDKLFADL
jgi:hypothetical protein